MKTNESMTTALTEFQEDYNMGDAFWLGPVVAQHRIGEYQFLEHRKRKVVACALTKELEPESKNEFCIFINERRLRRSASSLDEALVTAIAYKRDGHNSHAATYFMRMTEPTTPPPTPARQGR